MLGMAETIVGPRVKLGLRSVRWEGEYGIDRECRLEKHNSNTYIRQEALCPTIGGLWKDNLNFHGKFIQSRSISKLKGLFANRKWRHTDSSPGGAVCSLYCCILNIDFLIMFYG